MNNFECSFENCTFYTKYKNVLSKHLWTQHDIKSGKYCNYYFCELCDYKCKISDLLTSHIKCNHNDEKKYKCKHCNYKTKHNGLLNNHYWQIHNINTGNFKFHNCDKCSKNFKFKNSLDRHKKNIHKKKNIFFKCDINECNKIYKSKSSLKNHKYFIHNIGIKKEFICDQHNCYYKCGVISDLKKHKFNMHNIGNGKIYNCKLCNYFGKNSTHFKNHLSNVHDIGDKQCQLCLKNVYRLNDFKDLKINKELKICKECYKKASGGHESKKEYIMVEYLKQYYKNYIVLQDDILKGDDCNTKRRPDLLLASTENFKLIIECDENQHKGYNKKCNEGRTNEIIDEFKNGSVVFIRWNPDSFKQNNIKISIKREKRLEELKNVIQKCLDNTSYFKNENLYYNIYMYYDEDNECIIKSLPFQIIYNNDELCV